MGTDAAFATLGLAVGAPSIDITRAFRSLCRALHPDHGGDRSRFETVVDAYRRLQQAGLVHATASVRPMATRTRRNPYADLRHDLDRYAAMVPATPIARAQPARVSEAPTPSADRFTALLDQELARIAA